MVTLGDLHRLRCIHYVCGYSDFWLIYFKKGNMEELEKSPCCGTTPKLPDGIGTWYEFSCECGMFSASEQICDHMTIKERQGDPFTDHSYKKEYVDRAKGVAIKNWNTREPTSRSKELFKQLQGLCKGKAATIKMDMVGDVASLEISTEPTIKVSEVLRRIKAFCKQSDANPELAPAFAPVVTALRDLVPKELLPKEAP